VSGSESPRIEGQTIGQVLRETAVRSPDNDAFVFMESGERTTWNEFDRQTDRLAKSLLALGLRPGDHFGVWATNVSQWVRLQFATARIGVVLVTINPSYRPAELEYALRQADVRGLALIDAYRSMNYFDSLLEVCPELRDCRPGQLHSDRLPELRWVIALRGRPGPGMVAWEDLPGRSDEVTDEELVTIENGLAPEDRINIQYTSGTTGSPKGATLSHRNLLLNAWYAAECQRFTAADRICIPVPLYHCFGCVMGTLCSATHGSAMVFPSESFDAGATLRAIEEQRCTVIYGVPTMFIAQLEHADYPQRDLSSLRTGIMAGSPCPIELMKRVTEEFGAREITIGYGQTELSPLLTQTHPDDPLELRVGTVGRPIPGVEVKVVDPETGDDLGDGQQGEICGRGHCVMIGYYNQPAKTAEAIDADGWLHTGDLGVREPNGYFRVTGRLRDMIIRGGENVYPREIEERLYQHSAVEDVQVVGVPDRRLGEQVLACVKLRDRQSATETELHNFCAESLARFKVPRYWKFVESFPTTVTGKIQKFRIREQAIVELGLEADAEIETA
jgi:fatty-acyl-CoA synthase